MSRIQLDLFLLIWLHYCAYKFEACFSVTDDRVGLFFDPFALLPPHFVRPDVHVVGPTF